METNPMYVRLKYEEVDDIKMLKMCCAKLNLPFNDIPSANEYLIELPSGRAEQAFVLGAMYVAALTS